jgi:beta-glucanase (GH16 family)
MKALISLVVTVFIVNTLQAQSYTWDLVWADEFTGPSISSDWLYETGDGGWGNGELEYYTNRPENSIIHKGNLAIIARAEAYSGSNYTSARMITKNKQYWTYGKIEARLKLPTTRGVWPAFWMEGQNKNKVGWPKCGEIDIFEHVNAGSRVYGTMHWDNNGHVSSGSYTTISNLTQYHTYGIEWNSDSIKWFFDGKSYFGTNIKDSINNTEEFHRPFFVMLNVAVGGSFPGSPDGTSIFPDTMFVDYVRVYKNVPITSVEEETKQEDKITLSPNPVVDNLDILISSGTSGERSLEIKDLLGRTFYQKKIFFDFDNNAQISISMESFPPGAFIALLAGKDKVLHSKFVKQ